MMKDLCLRKREAGSRNQDWVFNIQTKNPNNLIEATP